MTTALAVTLAVVVAIPAIAGIVLLYSSLVLVRTVVRTSRQSLAKPWLTLDDKLMAYGESLLATLVAAIAFLVVVFAGSFLTAGVASVTAASLGVRPHFSLLEWLLQALAILVAFVGLLTTSMGGAVSFWSFYWRTLPALGSKEHPTLDNADRTPA